MKHAIITGASSGIGLETARQLANAGWKVTGIARSFEKCEAGFMRTVCLDLSQTDALTSSLKRNEFETPDALILNAGAGLFGGLEQLSEEKIRQTIDLNLISPMLVIKYFLPEMKRKSDADIVLMGSEAALAGAKQGAVYCASKFGLRGLAQSLRADCTGAGMRVMLINPGATQTAFFDDLHFEPKNQQDAVLKAEDVANALLSALSAPRHVVQEEIILQPLKKAFQTKPA